MGLLTYKNGRKWYERVFPLTSVRVSEMRMALGFGVVPRTAARGERGKIGPDDWRDPTGSPKGLVERLVVFLLGLVRLLSLGSVICEDPCEKKRPLAKDLYILVSFTVLLVLLFNRSLWGAAEQCSATDAWRLLGCTYIAAEAFIATVAVLLVNRHFHGREPTSSTRSILLLLIAYFELIFGFAAWYYYYPGCSFDMGISSAGEAVYFSAVTITTLGYGEIRPGEQPGRALIIVEVASGLVLLAVMLANFVSLASTKRNKNHDSDDGPKGDRDHGMSRLPANAETMWRLIERDLTVELVAEELWAPDADSPAADAAQYLRDHGFDVCGVTRDRRVVNWVSQEALSGVATCEDAMQSIHVEQLTAETTPLWEVLEPVTRQGRLFVITRHGVAGIVTTADLNKQPVRLLIFGLVSLLEMVMVSLTRTYHPGQSWTKLISSSRLDKAKELLEERRRQKQEIDLVDCLQFCDKTLICARTPQIADGWKMSKTAIQRLLGDAQKLRDHLAHSQDMPALDTWAETVAVLRTMEAVTRKGITLLDTTDPGRN